MLNQVGLVFTRVHMILKSHEMSFSISGSSDKASHHAGGLARLLHIPALESVLVWDVKLSQVFYPMAMLFPIETHSGCH